MAKKEASAIKKAQAAAAAAAAKSSPGNHNTSTSTSTSTSTPVSDSILLQPKSVTTTFAELQSAINTTTRDYFNHVTPKLKLIDLFLVFLVSLGILQFVYVLLIGNFPFNAFLGGFAICVGQFVLLVSLRLQINDQGSSGGASGKNRKSKGNKKSNAKSDQVEDIIDVDIVDNDNDDEDIFVVDNGADVVDGGGNRFKRVFTGISPERSFADFIFASLILHFIVIHFIN
ncbi:OST2 [Candida theae]|uniref:Dolichyl-diphosphooligosaccharide--protein glycosyltransferase subunit OST2 n=1 Tax=Candida theae TaxID=1198502 RepID=A0AAD5BC26_9ASCO|nr:OST2 [Candida theae]KAI5953770.1 OST2 [Candida theae]